MEPLVEAFFFILPGGLSIGNTVPKFGCSDGTATAPQNEASLVKLDPLTAAIPDMI